MDGAKSVLHHMTKGREGQMPGHITVGRRARWSRGIAVGICVLMAAFVRISAAVQAPTQRPAGVPVFVTSVGALSGFTDPSKDNQETVEDLRSAFAKYPEVTLADREAEARVVLVVQGREKGRQVIRLGPRPPVREWTVRLMFRFNGTETEMSATDTGAAKAARKVAEQVREWIRVNREKL